MLFLIGSGPSLHVHLLTFFFDECCIVLLYFGLLAYLRLSCLSIVSAGVLLHGKFMFLSVSWPNIL